MYVNVKNLEKLLSVFHPRKDPIYLGRYIADTPGHKMHVNKEIV